jgi:hypothetical protein
MRTVPAIALLVAGCSSVASPPNVISVPPSARQAAKSGFLVDVATATKPPIHLPKGGSGAFAVLAEDKSAADRNVIVQVDAGSLPIDAMLCQTVPNGQCKSAPTPLPLELNMGHNQPVSFSVFLTATDSIALGTVTVNFTQKGALLGSGKVTVTTKR